LDSYSCCLRGAETPEAALYSKISFFSFDFQKNIRLHSSSNGSATRQWIREQEISCTPQSESSQGAISLTNTQAFTTSLRVLLILLPKLTQVLFFECIMETIHIIEAISRDRSLPRVDLCCRYASDTNVFWFGEREGGGILRQVGLTASREGISIRVMLRLLLLLVKTAYLFSSCLLLSCSHSGDRRYRN